jgi:hypothetical protein
MRIERSVLRSIPSGTKPDDQASPTDLIDRVSHLREQRRAAEGRAGDERTQFHAMGHGG